MGKIRIFIADDHALLRSGVRLLIDAQDDMEVVGEAGDLLQTKRELAAARPDVLTLDLTMPGGSGMAIISAIRRAFPEIRILVVTMHDDPAYVRAALAMGAAGYVVKSAADTELISAIRAVHEGACLSMLSMRWRRPTRPLMSIRRVTPLHGANRYTQRA